MNSGGVLRWTARRLPGVEHRVRQDLIASVDELAEQGSRTDRALEVGSLIGFALRSASRRGAFDDRRELIRQGLRVGALVLAVTDALLSWTTADDLPRAAVAAMSSIVAIAVSGGLRRSAVALVTANVVLHGVVGGAPALLPIVVLGAVAVGHRFDARPCPIGAALAATAIVTGGIAAALLPAASTTTVLTVASAAVPIVLLAVGWFDPRYAVAGTVVWLWRFVAVDLLEIGDAIHALGDRFALRLLLVRGLLMGAGVLIGWQISNAAIDRCLTVFRRP